MLQTCSIRLWDLNLPSDLLEEILSRLSRLGLKDNVYASAVCKTWLEAAVSVRKFETRPWLFYPQKGSEDEWDYILCDPSGSQTYRLNFPELNTLARFYDSKDGWLLVIKDNSSVLLLLNPFTKECIYFPEGPIFSQGYHLAFSTASTSSSCLVFSLDYTATFFSGISTWRPGETEWTKYRFENQSISYLPIWNKCVYSNGMFYSLSTSGDLGVFDPSRETWNVIPVKSSPLYIYHSVPMSMTEHKGDIFVCTYLNDNQKVLKLNLKRNVWDAMRELGGLAIFVSHSFSLTRAGLSAEDKNIIYTPHNRIGNYYSLDSHPTSNVYLSEHFTYWVDPPHNKL